MNKKGRWKLPDIIKSKIKDGEFDDESFAVQLLEHHKILNKNNCISIHTSKSPKKWKEDERSKEKKNDYLNSGSLLAPQRDNLTRRERRRRIFRALSQEDEDEEPVVNTSSVRYQVVYPPSTTSCLAYTPKYTGYVSDYNDRNAACCCHATHGKPSTRRPAYGRKFYKEVMEEMLYAFEDESDADHFSNSEDDEYEYSKCDRENTFTLEDMICQPKVQTPRQHKRRHSSSTKSDTSNMYSENSHIVYEQLAPTPTTSTKPEEVDVLNTDKRNVQSVLVSLPNEDTDPHTLKHKYREMYTECACHPRKFIIDISHEVKTTQTSNTAEESGIITCVVFALDIDNEMNNKQDSVYKVTLTSSVLTHIGHCKIETLFDNMETSLGECLRRTVFYLETLPEFISDTDVRPKITHRPKKQRSSNIEKCAKWESDSYVPNPKIHFSTYLSSLNDQYDRDEKMDWKSDAPSQDQVCDICYELLDGQITGTALVSCGHWFCDACWTEYLEGRVNAGTMSLTCPEFDCDKVVDPATVVTFLSLRDVIRHAKYRHDTGVESGDHTKWCPNSKCGRVLKVNSVCTKIANCLCGQTFCFDCGRQAHWPAKCEAFTNYFKRLKDTGDIGLAPVGSLDRVIVNGKNCPNCKKFVEKAGGCPYMACVCGSSFCWGCGKDWGRNSHDNSCYSQGYKNNHNTYEVMIEDDRLKRNNQKENWYNIAVKHRSEQHILKMEKMKSARKELVPHLSSFISRSAKKGIFVSLEFEGQSSVYRHEQDKLLEYLNEMIELHRELNQLLENIAVMMDFESVSTNKTLSIIYLTNRMASYADAISKGFSEGPTIKPGELLTMFKKTRVHSYRTIKSVVSLLNKLDL